MGLVLYALAMANVFLVFSDFTFCHGGASLPLRLVFAVAFAVLPFLVALILARLFTSSDLGVSSSLKVNLEIFWSLSLTVAVLAHGCANAASLKPQLCHFNEGTIPPPQPGPSRGRCFPNRSNGPSTRGNSPQPLSLGKNSENERCSGEQERRSKSGPVRGTRQDHPAVARRKRRNLILA
jgi:hypothetical protein